MSRRFRQRRGDALDVGLRELRGCRREALGKRLRSGKASAHGGFEAQAPDRIEERSPHRLEAGRDPGVPQGIEKKGACISHCGLERLALVYVGDCALQGVVRPVDQHVGHIAEDEVGREDRAPFGEAVPRRYRPEKLREPIVVEGMSSVHGGVAHEAVNKGRVLVEPQEIEHGPLEARRRQPVDHHDVRLVERAP